MTNDLEAVLALVDRATTEDAEAIVADLRGLLPTLREAVRDAGRYRWLREYEVDSYLARGSCEQLDAEIDAAMLLSREVK